MNRKLLIVSQILLTHLVYSMKTKKIFLKGQKIPLITNILDISRKIIYFSKKATRISSSIVHFSNFVIFLKQSGVFIFLKRI